VSHAREESPKGIMDFEAQVRYAGMWKKAPGGKAMIYRARVLAWLCIIAIGLLGMATTAVADSWPPYTFNSYIMIQNMSDGPAQIVASFVGMGASGTPVHTEPCPETAPGDNCTIRPHWIDDTLLPNGKYSVVLYSSAEIAASENLQTVDGHLASFVTPPANAPTIYFPNFNKNYFNWNTPVYVQNTGTEAISMTLELFPVGGAAVYFAMDTPLVNPGASFEFDPVDQGGLVDGAYSMVVTSSDPTVNVAGTLVQIRPTPGQEMAVNAFTQGAETVYCPNINRNYGAENWTTPIIIQNMGSSAVEPDVYYYAVNVGGYAPGTLVFSATLASAAPGNSVVERPHWRSDTDLPAGVYSVKIVGPSGSELVATVNQESQNVTAGSLAYGCFISGGSKVFLPNVNKYYGAEKWNTPIIIQNVGTSTADVKVEYVQAGSVVATVTSANDPTLLMAPGGGSVQRPHFMASLPDGKYSAVVTSLGGSPQPLVAVVNQHGTLSGGDSAVEGIAVP
jgi:hypothetical protein